MTEKEIQELKKFLEEKKKRLEEELESIADENLKTKKWEPEYPKIESEVFGEEEADEIEEYQARVSIVDILQRDLNNVILALEKIERGTYGKCEKCQKEIEKERLKALPEAKYCRECTDNVS